MVYLILAGLFIVFHFFLIIDDITLYHHTDEASARKILKSGKIRKSEQKSANDDAVHGDGTYLTAIGPGASRSKVARNNYDGTNRYWKSKQDKTDVAIEVKVPRSKVTDHSDDQRSVFKYEGDVNLKDARDMKVHIRGNDGIQTYAPN